MSAKSCPNTAAFGDRDGILAHAIAEHIEALREEWGAGPLCGDIDSILAEYDTVAIEIARNSAYNRMLVALFFSVNPIASALASIRSLPAERIERWLAQAPPRSLLPTLDRDRAVDRYVNSELSTYRYWASGRIPLPDLADELRINFLSALLEITAGPTRTDIARRHALLCGQMIARH
ncbi:AcrR family transcriptional regulator [Sphingosinicella soli]|uniref:AcrR family transcriptional regulator n=1 Tax=Sphingosinicella soli TaxID=333708 RepID=A0A7W7B1N2_9SPHN|nr:AcrR family transcriptional regulator [Sphingosinicella soli]